MTNDIDATARLDMGHTLRPASQRVRVQLRSKQAGDIRLSRKKQSLRIVGAVALSFASVMSEQSGKPLDADELRKFKHLSVDYQVDALEPFSIPFGIGGISTRVFIARLSLGTGALVRNGGLFGIACRWLAELLGACSHLGLTSIDVGTPLALVS